MSSLVTSLWDKALRPGTVMTDLELRDPGALRPNLIALPAAPILSRNRRRSTCAFSATAAEGETGMCRELPAGDFTWLVTWGHETNLAKNVALSRKFWASVSHTRDVGPAEAATRGLGCRYNAAVEGATVGGPEWRGFSQAGGRATVLVLSGDHVPATIAPREQTMIAARRGTIISYYFGIGEALFAPNVTWQQDMGSALACLGCVTAQDAAAGGGWLWAEDILLPYLPFEAAP